jgi:hypothetical protein
VPCNIIFHNYLTYQSSWNSVLQSAQHRARLVSSECSRGRGKCRELRRRRGVRRPKRPVRCGLQKQHPEFRRIVTTARALGRRVIGCNLTITRLPNYRWIPSFLADHGVEVTASPPYFQARQTDAQRGDGVFEESVEALPELNTRGYGQLAGGWCSIWSRIRSARSCRQHAAESDWTRELERGGTASYSTTYSRSPTCRSAVFSSISTSAGRLRLT